MNATIRRRIGKIALAELVVLPLALIAWRIATELPAPTDFVPPGAGWLQPTVALSATILGATLFGITMHFMQLRSVKAASLRRIRRIER